MYNINICVFLPCHPFYNFTGSSYDFSPFFWLHSVQESYESKALLPNFLYRLTFYLWQFQGKWGDRLWCLFPMSLGKFYCNIYDLVFISGIRIIWVCVIHVPVPICFIFHLRSWNYCSGFRGTLFCFVFVCSYKHYFRKLWKSYSAERFPLLAGWFLLSDKSYSPLFLVP